MPELRLNVITRDWVIIATERAKRPNLFAVVRKEQPPLPAFQPDCPFCPGNEHETGKEVLRLGDEKGWRVRVFTNKYPALSSGGERRRTERGIERSMSGVGFHEVIVEHPRHDVTTALLSVAEVTDILTAYRLRYTQLRQDPRLEAIILFKNHGEIAGSSIVHSHSQLAATPVVPFQFRARMEEAMRYFDENGECIFCRTLRDELAAGERIIEQTEHFVAFSPYAALSPFHTWIFPRRHSSSFEEITDTELVDLARNLKATLAKLYYGLNDPPFNYAIRSAPTRERHGDYYHWYVTIIPRVTKTAGFEFGSGMFINTVVPEEGAKFLRDMKLP
jgi:UDPglucose--hexose-1-phosphate uridylyltransferase